jgi:hypothetical protein
LELTKTAHTLFSKKRPLKNTQTCYDYEGECGCADYRIGGTNSLPIKASIPVVAQKGMEGYLPACRRPGTCHCDDCRKEQSDFDKTVDAIIANNEAVKAAAAPISGVDVSDLYGLHRLRDDEVLLSVTNDPILGEISVYKKVKPIKAADPSDLENSEFLAHVNRCQCGEFANVFIGDVWCCGVCALARMSPTTKTTIVVSD